jgi:hypothetical protein
MYYVFRPIAAIMKYTDLLQSPFFLSAIPPYTGQCLRIGSALYKYVVYVMSLCYKMYWILNIKIFKNVVTWSLKTGTAEPEQMFIVRQGVGKHVPAEMNTQATLEELLFLCNGELNTPP